MILVVDDHLDTGRFLIRLLALHDLHAECVADPTVVLTLVCQRQHECIILDDNMPELTGLEILRAIRTTPALLHLPVIIYSAGQERARQDAARCLGASDWIVKGGGTFDSLIARAKELTGAARG